MSSINELPNEILLEIFQHFSPKDLKAAVLVCHRWSTIMGEDPSFWIWAVVTLGSKEDYHKLNSPRLQMLEEIKVAHCNDRDYWYSCGYHEKECHWRKHGMDGLFNVIFEIPTIRRISGIMLCEGLSAVEPKLLVSVLIRLEKLYLMDMTPEKIEHLFTAMAMNSMLKSFRVENVAPLSELNPLLFASAISNVNEVSMADDDMTYQYACIHPEVLLKRQLMMHAFFSLLATYERPLKKLKVDACLTSFIDPETLGFALNMLEEVTVTGYQGWLSGPQVNAIMKILVDGPSKLKKLMLEELNPEVAEQMNQDHVRKATEKLGEFYFIDYVTWP